MVRWLVIAIAGGILGGCAAGRLPYSVDADTIPQPLAAVDANSDLGREIFVERERGHCVLCHRVAGLDAPFQGNLGPDLTRVGARLTSAQIRLRIVDASRLNPDTVMPAYYRTSGLRQVAEAYRGKPVLPAEDVEQLVAWLSLQKGEGGDG